MLATCIFSVFHFILMLSEQMIWMHNCSFLECLLYDHYSVYLGADNSPIQTLLRFDKYTAKFTCYILPAKTNFSVSLTVTDVSWIFVSFGLKGYTKASCSFCLNSTHACIFKKWKRKDNFHYIYMKCFSFPICFGIFPKLEISVFTMILK